MRRIAAFFAVVVCAWFVGCTHFITQSRSDFFSKDKGPNADVFDEGSVLVPSQKAPEPTPDKK